MTLYSSVEKLTLLQWLFRNNRQAFENSLKVQKFLFFYELYSKVSAYEYELTKLRAYEKGPVFSQVWGDYRYRKNELVSVLNGEDIDAGERILNIEPLLHANFIISTENTMDLVGITHEFDCWKSKYNEGGYNITINESDITDHDINLADALYDGYDTKLIRDSEILYLDPAKFIFKKGERDKLSEEQLNALEEVACSGEIDNPMFVNIAEDGVLEID